MKIDWPALREQQHEHEASVKDFLLDIGLARYAGDFIGDGYDSMDALEAASKSDLLAIGLLPGHVTLLLRRLRERTDEVAERSPRAAEPSPPLLAELPPKSALGWWGQVLDDDGVSELDTSGDEDQGASDGCRVNEQLRRKLCMLLRRPGLLHEDGYARLSDINFELDCTESLAEAEQVLRWSRRQGMPQFELVDTQQDLLVRLAHRVRCLPGAASAAPAALPISAPAVADLAYGSASPMYIVVQQTCAIREAPSVLSPCIGARPVGAIVALGAADATGRRLALGDARREGWMLLSRPDLGDLLLEVVH